MFFVAGGLTDGRSDILIEISTSTRVEVLKPCRIKHLHAFHASAAGRSGFDRVVIS